ncbi:mite group 2 allergen Gly d 2.02-like [Anoplophora glabripennis]|uniref:mite group 2 allergen Gly d 2.02-like n=1 Tax=Anoplophora glabripennis TaxID=217634 RepID=UPI0008745DAF|nr:mite group 2 allergen Gly d 2.02-like [Anoplophora glabripennis]
MKVLASLALLALVNYAYAADTTVVKSCHDALLPEVKVTIDNTVCAEGPCVVGTGSDVSVMVSFDTPVKLEHIKAKFVASGSSGDIEIPLDQDDACVGIVNTKCPVAANDHVDYEYTTVLDEEYPEGDATVTITLLDEDNDDAEVICFSLDISIKNS